MSPKTIRDIWNRRTWARFTAHSTAPAEPTLAPPREGGVSSADGPAEVSNHHRDPACPARAS